MVFKSVAEVKKNLIKKTRSSITGKEVLAVLKPAVTSKGISKMDQEFIATIKFFQHIMAKPELRDAVMNIDIEDYRESQL